SCQLIALGFFLANGEQPYTGTLSPEHTAEIDLAHDSKLLKIVRFAIYIGAHIEQDGNRIDRGGEDRSQRRPIHTWNSAEHHLGGDHGCAGIACGDETSGTTLADQSQSHSN